jgi:hypothetical protein
MQTDPYGVDKQPQEEKERGRESKEEKQIQDQDHEQDLDHEHEMAEEWDHEITPASTSLASSDDQSALHDKPATVQQRSSFRKTGGSRLAGENLFQDLRLVYLPRLKVCTLPPSK